MNALFIRFEHMRFGYKRETMPERRIAAGVAGTVPVFGPAIFDIISKRIDIRNEIKSFLFHQFIQSRFELFAEIITHGTTEFALLGRKQGHHVLVVGPIAYMVINKYIWIK